LPHNDELQEWNFPVSDKAEGRKNPQGLAKDRVEAKTLFKVIKSNSYFSLVEFQLLTGRQHQIRKHAALARHAILGDPRYGEPKYNEKMAKIYETSRMFLHAQSLSIVIHGERRNFYSESPPEFLNVLSPN
jgi:tRNA pseudouridine65 synthase